MNSIRIIFKNIRNLIPYLLLIATYFFFVNIEASKENKKIQYKEDNVNQLPRETSIDDKEHVRLSIPVIPYKD